MKRFFIVVITLIIIPILYLCFAYSKVITWDENFIVRNESGKVLDARVYKTSIKLIDSSAHVDAYVVYFDDIERPNILRIVPIAKSIQIVDYDESSFLKITDNYLLQKKGGEAFTELGTEINNSFEQGITDYYFSDSVIYFNPFWDLERLGKRIILQRIK